MGLKGLGFGVWALGLGLGSRAKGLTWGLGNGDANGKNKLRDLWTLNPKPRVSGSVFSLRDGKSAARNSHSVTLQDAVGLGIQHCLNGVIQGTTRGVCMGDARSLDPKPYKPESTFTP